MPPEDDERVVAAPDARDAELPEFFGLRIVALLSSLGLTGELFEFLA